MTQIDAKGSSKKIKLSQVPIASGYREAAFDPLVGNNFIGTEFDPNLSYAKAAEECGLRGVTVKTQAALRTPCANPAMRGRRSATERASQP